MTVHVVEPGGRGGVYHHAAAAADALADALAAANVPVVFLTASDAESLETPAGGEGGARAVRRACFWRLTRLRPAPLRRAAIAAAWLAAGVPRALAGVGPGDVVHIEGRFRPALLVPLAVGANLLGASLAFSPHTTFPRRGRAWEERVVRWLARRADVLFTFSEYDRRVLESWGAHPVVVPLLPPPVVPDADLTAHWRDRWDRDAAAPGARAAPGTAGERARRPVALFAGQLRPDKGLDLAVRAARLWRGDVRLAVVGEDQGALSEARRLSAALSVDILVEEGYVPLPLLAAAVAAADVVLCPYRQASRSGIAALARAIGRPIVGTTVGGLPEAATAVVPPEDPQALAEAVEKVLAGAAEAPEPVRPEPAAAARAYLAAYGLR